MNNNPKLRFKKKNGKNYPDWEFFKLGDVADISAAGDLDKLKFSKQPTKKAIYPVYSNALTNYGLYGFYTEFQYDGLCVTITARGMIGHAQERNHKFYPIGRLLTLYNLKTNYKLLTEAINIQIQFHSETTGVPQLTAVSAKIYKLILPTDTEEQEQIANFFTHLDSQIDDTNNTLEQLKTYKKNMLQKMFSESGNPEVRFKAKKGGDYPDWEFCRLEEHVSKLGDGIHGTPQYDDDGDYFFINGNNLNQTKIILDSNTKRVNKVTYKKYKKNLNTSTVFISINGTLGNTAFYNNEQIILGKSTCYFNVNSTLNKFYIRYYLTTDSFLNYLYIITTGTTIKNLSLKSMRELQIPLPCLEEQEQIADFFTGLDNQIDDTNNKLEQLKTYKKSMLQRMFV